LHCSELPRQRIVPRGYSASGQRMLQLEHARGRHRLSHYRRNARLEVVEQLQFGLAPPSVKPSFDRFAEGVARDVRKCEEAG
jgi:hypothetical protein